MPEARRGETGRVVSLHALRDQEALWVDLLKLAGTVEEMLTLAVQGLTEGRGDLTAEVKAREQAINGWEVQIERECLRILALYEPVASDLRRLSTVLRVNGDLERISNLAHNVAKRVTKRRATPGRSRSRPAWRTWR